MMLLRAKKFEKFEARNAQSADGLALPSDKNRTASEMSGIIKSDCDTVWTVSAATRRFSRDFSTCAVFLLVQGNSTLK
jgi:hypothetical protein